MIVMGVGYCRFVQKSEVVIVGSLSELFLLQIGLVLASRHAKMRSITAATTYSKYAPFQVVSAGNGLKNTPKLNNLEFDDITRPGQFRMATSQSPKAVQIRHGARKSIGHQPSPDINTEKENMTLGNISTMSSMMDTKAERKKKRSKSIGPGGLDALMEDAGNRRKVYFR